MRRARHAVAARAACLAHRASRVALLALGAVSAARLASAQTPAAWSTHDPITLRLHPRAGDTLHTRLEQQTSVSDQTHAASGTAARPMTTSVIVTARTIVQASRASTTTVLTIVDSATVRSSDARGASMSAQAERMLRNQRLVMQLAEDGSVESARDEAGAAVPRDMAEAMASMPAVFPHKAVGVGEQWEREMPLPSTGAFGARGSAHVRARFKLDSLSRGGALAFVSMHGDIVSDDDAQGLQLAGNVSGTMRVDRARGWMTDSQFSVLIRSVVTPPASSGMAPMHFVTKVTQHLRTMDKR